MSHPRPTPRPSPDAGPPGRGHRPHVPRLPSSLDPSHHPARSITRPGVTTPRQHRHPGHRFTNRADTSPARLGPTPADVSLHPPPRHPDPQRHRPGRPDPRLLTPLFPHRKWAENGVISRPSKKGQKGPPKPTAKICYTLDVCFSLNFLAIHPPTGPPFCRLHKFVTPHSYEIPPFSLAQPRAKICDTPQLRNTPQIPGTALAANESLFPSPK